MSDGFRPIYASGLVGVVGLCVAAATLGLTAEGYGAVLLGLSLMLPAPYAVAIGHVLLVALSPDGIDQVAFVVTEAGLLATLIDAGVARVSGRDLIVTLVGVGISIGSVWIALAGTRSLWTGVAVLAIIMAFGSYGLHRYQLVEFDLVEAN
ncbi:hypothetical protein G9464_02285 [Halostella sp. JP-L12]|uniref:hypothetical protein n=1 Tax=Halostella TaxID=1843185 RepID=UPI000EF7A11A|nr:MULTISPECIES: hypothetical protein [Halostella]NHN46430.1 hypothetical protein [Halostella sp. JP-L12]